MQPAYSRAAYSLAIVRKGSLNGLQSGDTLALCRLWAKVSPENLTVTDGGFLKGKVAVDTLRDLWRIVAQDRRICTRCAAAHKPFVIGKTRIETFHE
jgi:hypothetical protein